MKAQIIQIGNSQGIRIPKVLLEESGISGEVEVELHPDGIMIRKAQKPRAGWEDAFRAMAENDDDEGGLDSIPTQFERSKWQW